MRRASYKEIANAAINSKIVKTVDDMIEASKSAKDGQRIEMYVNEEPNIFYFDSSRVGENDGDKVINGWVKKIREIPQEVLDAAINSTIVKSVEALENLALTAKDGQKCYLDDGGRSGNFTMRASRKDENDGGTIFNGMERDDVTVIIPEMFGAIGDGINDDTIAINKVCAIGKSFILLENSEYIVKDTLRIYPNEKIFTIFGSGTIKFLSDANELQYGFLIKPMADMDAIYIGSISIDGSNKTCLPFYIKVDDSRTVNNIFISKIAVSDISNIETKTSAVGCMVVSKNSDIISIDRVNIKNINRDISDSSKIASVGIHISTSGKFIISNSVIENITNTDVVDKADSDAIQVFSSDASESGNKILSTNGAIFNNTLKNAKGRFIKLKTPNAKIYGNKIIIDNFETSGTMVIVDAQHGGVEAYNNTISINNEIGGNMITPFSLGGTVVGGLNSLQENSKIHNNTIILDTYMETFFCKADFSSVSQASLSMYNNNVLISYHALDTVNAIYKGALYLIMPDDDTSHAIKKINIDISTNTIPLPSSGRFVQISGGNDSQFTIPDNKDKWSLFITNNINSNISPTGDENPLYLTSTWFGQNIKIAHNINMNNQYLRMNGLDAFKLPEGSSFHFSYGSKGHDDGAMLNVPAIYNANCNILNVDNNAIEIANSDASKIIRYTRSSETWYEYAGTAL